MPIAGMELTTAEDIHLLCLFSELKDALAFSDHVYKRIPNFKNNEKVFGNQIVMGEDDAELYREEKLLITATDIDVYSAVDLVRNFGGVVYPAHIDRRSNGIIAVLGDIPFDAGFTTLEFNDFSKKSQYGCDYPLVAKLKSVCSSDAHNLGDINEPENFLNLSQKSAKSVVDYLKSKN